MITRRTQISAIAEPEYLNTISGNGDLDKLGDALAAHQILATAS